MKKKMESRIVKQIVTFNNSISAAVGFLIPRKMLLHCGNVNQAVHWVIYPKTVLAYKLVFYYRTLLFKKRMFDVLVT